MKSLNSIVVAFQFSPRRALFRVLKVTIDDQELKLLLEWRPWVVLHGVLHGNGGTLVIPRLVVETGIFEGFPFELASKVIHHVLAAVSKGA